MNDLTDEEFRALCEAREVAKFPTAEQREWYLDGVARKRNPQAAQALRVMVGEILRGQG